MYLAGSRVTVTVRAVGLGSANPAAMMSLRATYQVGLPDVTARGNRPRLQHCANSTESLLVMNCLY